MSAGCLTRKGLFRKDCSYPIRLFVTKTLGVMFSAVSLGNGSVVLEDYSATLNGEEVLSMSLAQTSARYSLRQGLGS